MKEKFFQGVVGFLKFAGLVLLCGTVATAAVFMLKYKPEPEPMVEIYSVRVENIGKTVEDIYGEISPEGPIKPYDLMCAAHELKGQDYERKDVVFPAWFHAPGGYVSSDAVCSLNGDELRKDYPSYQEIGS